MSDVFLLMATALLVCIPGAAYMLRVLLYDHEATGPFKAKQTFVKVNDTVTRQVNAFDWFRRVFGAYRVQPTEANGGSFWVVNPQRIDLWLCPKCLSFWLSTPWSVGIGVYLVLQTGDVRNLLLIPLLHLQVAWWTQFLVFYQLKAEAESG